MLLFIRAQLFWKVSERWCQAKIGEVPSKDPCKIERTKLALQWLNLTHLTANLALSSSVFHFTFTHLLKQVHFIHSITCTIYSIIVSFSMPRILLRNNYGSWCSGALARIDPTACRRSLQDNKPQIKASVTSSPANSSFLAFISFNIKN